MRVVAEASEVGDVESLLRLRSAPISSDTAVFAGPAEASDAARWDRMSTGSTAYVLKNILPVWRMR